MPNDPDGDFADTDYAATEWPDTDPVGEHCSHTECVNCHLADGDEQTSEVDAADESCDLDEDNYELLPQRSVLDAVDNAFRLLSVGPSPLSVDGTALGHGLPARPIPVVELRNLLVGQKVSSAAQEAVWRFLVGAAQNDGPEWVVAAAGMAVPGLRNIARQYARDDDGDAEEILAEVLAGFTERLRTLDPDAGMLSARLVWAAERAGAKRRAAEWRLQSRKLPFTESMDPPSPEQGHPDLVLAEAIRDGVLTEFEASVIGDTRLGETKLGQLARHLGYTYEQLFYLRECAEYRLGYYLTGTRPKKP